MNIIVSVSVSQKSPPCGFQTFFPKRLGTFNKFLYTYYAMFLSTLDDKLLFNCLQIWRSYVTLSEATHRFFCISLEV